MWGLTSNCSKRESSQVFSKGRPEQVTRVVFCWLKCLKTRSLAQALRQEKWRIAASFTWQTLSPYWCLTEHPPNTVTSSRHWKDIAEPQGKMLVHRERCLSRRSTQTLKWSPCPVMTVGAVRAVRAVCWQNTAPSGKFWTGRGKGGRKCTVKLFFFKSIISVCAAAQHQVWRSGDNFAEPVLSRQPYVDSRAQTRRRPCAASALPIQPSHQPGVKLWISKEK